MPVRLLTADAALSTSAGSWKLCDAANLTVAVDNTNADDLNTTRYTASFDPTDGITIQGVYLFIGRAASYATGNVTVTLQENTGSWVDVAGTAANKAVSALALGKGGVYIAFAAPTVASTNLYRVKVVLTGGSAGYVWLCRSTTAGDYTYAIAANGDDVSKIQSGDTALIDAGVTLTIDESLTLGATNGRSMILGGLSTVLVPPPGAPITLAMGAGGILFSSQFTFRVGDSDLSPVTTTNQVSITNADATGGLLFRFCGYYYDYLSGAGNRGSFEFYGQQSADLRLVVASNALAAQNVVNTVEDIPATWIDGDVVTFAGKDRHASDGVTYYAKKTGAKQITLYTDGTLSVAKNLDYLLLAGAAVVNFTEGSRGLGIQISSTNQTYLIGSQTYITQVGVGKLVFQGVNLSAVHFSLPDRGGTGSVAPSIKSVLMRTNNNDLSGGVIFYYSPTPQFSGGVMENVHLLNDTMGYANLTFAALQGTFTKITTRGRCAATYLIGGSGNTVSDIICSQSYTSGSGYYMAITGAGHVITDFTMIGGRVHWNCSGSRITRYKQQRCSETGNYFKASVNNVFIDSAFGAGATNTGSDISCEAFAYATNVFLNCTIGSLGITGSSGLAPGSYLRWHQYNATANDHRAWETYGTLVSTGFGLGDTTVWNGSAFAAAVAGQLGMKFRPNSGTLSFVYQDNSPNTTTIGNCQGLPVQVSVRVKIPNAAFYAGVYTLPTLRVVYDGSTVATCVAAASTGDQQLFVNITPATTTGDITVTVEAATDAGVNGDYYVGELVVLKPAGIVVDTTRFGLWGNGLPLGSVKTFPAPASAWDEVRAAHAGTGTFGEAITKIFNLCKAILGGLR